ncbi:hypothetical protein [Larkinella punicea]|uniref:PIN like domain-containing protein n=1 Tax=Larkinella punicea TaxID=2315727 RepID=A0A368JLD8_9BACT|nr:hypothetical protein [Larkinella punicea]RCR67876.1 hypothetical protein DUE52_19310 [Larkinella punicea]
MDIIEILLDSYTDFVKFERLATEIMLLEGFGTITPIGGLDDEGIDAEIIKYFKDKTERIIFQFTIQENVGSKITDTIKKLKENKIDFQQLIVVTKNEVNNVQKYRTDARIKHTINLDIFEKATFIKHIGTNKSLLTRYFPDAKAQLNSDLFERKSIFSSSSSDALEISLLKCSLLFTFNPNVDGKRKRLFDHTVLSLVVAERKPISKVQLKERFKNHFGKEIEIGEIDATITRLKKDNYIEVENESILPTQATVEKIEGSLSKINSSTKALIDDIITKVKKNSEERIDKRTEGIITNNIKQTLSAYFRLYGIEYSQEKKFKTSKESFKENNDLIALAKKSLPAKLSDFVIYSIGETLNSPTEKQTETLANWAKAFIGAQIMGVDFKLSNFQATRISQKTFIIDTDFLLYCIVQDCSLSSIYLKTIKELQNLGCKIVIPEEVIHESIKHAEFSYRSYNYFKTSIDSIDPIVLEDKIGNIYVKGYFKAVTSGKIDSSEISFKAYLENFYDKERPFAFMKELLLTIFLEKIAISGISSLSTSTVPTEEIEELTTYIYEETIGTVKGGYRTEEENREVAKTDAKLFLATYYLNSKIEKSDEILSGSHYLITSSTRTLRCASKMGFSANVISKPSTIINLLEKIGQFRPTSNEIVDLFENPYLIDAVNNSWNDIKALVDAGVSLKGKNIIRLKWDLDAEIKAFIATQNISSEFETDSEKEKTTEYISFLRNLKSKGYTLMPEVELLEAKISELEAEVTTTQEHQEKLQSEIDKFGIRRKKYLERIKKGNKNK